MGNQIIIEKDNLSSEERSIAEVTNNYFLDILKSLSLKDSSKLIVNNVGNIRHSFNNFYFKNHLSQKVIRKKTTDNGEFRFQPISTLELKNIIIVLDFNKSSLNASIPANVLKDTCVTFVPYITEIVNDYFQAGNFSNESKLTEVVYKIKDALNKKKLSSCDALSHCQKLFMNK